MTDSEIETMRLLASVATRETRKRLTLTREQCLDIFRMYAADPLYVRYPNANGLNEALGQYRSRRRNVQMNALLITCLNRAMDDLIVLRVGRRMALGLLAMFDDEVRGRALNLAEKWLNQRTKGTEE